MSTARQMSDETRDQILQGLGEMCSEYAGYCYTLQQEQRRSWADDIPQAVARKLRGDGPGDDYNPFYAYLTVYQADELAVMAMLAGAWPVWSDGLRRYVEGVSYNRWQALW